MHLVVVHFALSRRTDGEEASGGRRSAWGGVLEGQKQHQGMDRPGVGQVPEGSGERGGKWRKLVAKSSVVPQRPSRLRDR